MSVQEEPETIKSRRKSRRAVVAAVAVMAALLLLGTIGCSWLAHSGEDWVHRNVGPDPAPTCDANNTCG